jgi:hypothetical protein
MKVAVAPPFAVNVVRYYLRDTRAAGAAISASDSETRGSDVQVLLIGDQWNAREKAAKLLAQYSHVLAGFRGVRIYDGDVRAQ